MPVLSGVHHDRIYCSEQINIPVTLPSILKDYVKAAIRTQPYDLLGWTAAYFRALANDELPPVKERLEYPPFVHASGVTPGFLKTLLNQYRGEKDRGQVAGRPTRVNLESLLRRWRGMALGDASLYQILMTGRLLDLPGDPKNCDLYQFLATACGLLGNSLYETMIEICELLSEEPEGGSATVPFDVFMNLYEYLASLDCSGGQSIVAPGQSGTETGLGKDEASPGRSSRLSFSSPNVSTSGCSGAKETPPRCPSIDNSIGATDTQESFSSSECPSTGESAAVLEESRIVEEEDFGFSGIPETSPRGVTTVEPRPESPSENRSNGGKRFEWKPEKSAVERLGPVESEVTRVQEVRRGDLENHSRVEKVMVDDETRNVMELHGSSVSFATSPRQATLSFAESHVPEELPVCESATESPSQEVDPQVSAVRSIPLAREAGGADVAEHSSQLNDSIEEVSPYEGATPKILRSYERIHSETHEDVANVRTGRTEGETEKNGRDSPEYDDISERKVPATPTGSLRSEDGNEWKISTKNAAKDETFGPGILMDPRDYVHGEFYGEEFEDVGKYETIDLENVRRVTCECHEARKDDPRNLKGESGEPRETTATSDPVDLLAEFFDRMRVTECSNGFYVIPEVPGIGPPVNPKTVTAVGIWLTECSRRQQGQVGPRNLRHFLCPSLDGASRKPYSVNCQLDK